MKNILIALQVILGIILIISVLAQLAKHKDSV